MVNTDIASAQQVAMHKVTIPAIEQYIVGKGNGCIDDHVQDVLGALDRGELLLADGSPEILAADLPCFLLIKLRYQ